MSTATIMMRNGDVREGVPLHEAGDLVSAGVARLVRIVDVPVAVVKDVAEAKKAAPFRKHQVLPNSDLDEEEPAGSTGGTRNGRGKKGSR
jgi:hypothetical protein